MVDLPPGPEAIELEPMLWCVSLIPLDAHLRVDSPVLDLLGHGKESLLDVGGVLGRGLEEGDAELVGKGLGGSVVDHLFGRQVRLVSDQELVDTLDGVAVNLLEPLLDVGEGVAVGNVVDDDDAMCS